LTGRPHSPKRPDERKWRARSPCGCAAAAGAVSGLRFQSSCCKLSVALLPAGEAFGRGSRARGGGAELRRAARTARTTDHNKSCPKCKKLVQVGQEGRHTDPFPSFNAACPCQRLCSFLPMPPHTPWGTGTQCNPLQSRGLALNPQPGNGSLILSEWTKISKLHPTALTDANMSFTVEA
jgi:hypothetical protein